MCAKCLLCLMRLVLCLADEEHSQVLIASREGIVEGDPNLVID